MDFAGAVCSCEADCGVFFPGEECIPCCPDKFDFCPAPSCENLCDEGNRGYLDINGNECSCADSCGEFLIPCCDDKEDICGSGCEKDCDGDRRRLVTNSDEEDAWMTYKTTCGGREFEVGFLIDGHLAIIATPQTSVDECNPIILHSVIEGKKIELVDDKDLPIPDDKYVLLDTKTYPLEAILDAYGKAHAPKNGEYDLLTNNCGDFLVDMGSHLGLIVTPEIVLEVTQAVHSQDMRKEILAALFQNKEYVASSNLTSFHKNEWDFDILFQFVESHTKEFHPTN